MNDKLTRWRWMLGSLMLSGALGLGLWGVTGTLVWADRGGYDDDHDYAGGNSARYGQDSSPAAVLYRDECGSCHLAYPPGLLPAESWQAVMASLDDHFGDNATLLLEDGQAIGAYLQERAADTGRYRDRRYAAASSDAGPVLRITELPYFVREHDEIPDSWVTGNPEVGGFSQCDSCHTKAAEGSFDEDSVTIPGHGRWDD